MSVSSTFSTDKSGTKRQVANLKCDHCGHTGIAKLYREPQMDYWNLSELSEDKSRRGSFNWHEYSYKIYCTCVGECVFGGGG